MIIRWRKPCRDAVRRKLQSGAKPQEVKDSFGRMVDELTPPVDKLAQAKAEIARLTRELKKAHVTSVKVHVPLKRVK